MSDYKTLQELWIENDGKPFDAVDNEGCKFHVIAISPSKSTALGWNDTGYGISRLCDQIYWKFAPKPKKIIFRIPKKLNSINWAIINETDSEFDVEIKVDE